jgi:hypothetical protein
MMLIITSNEVFNSLRADAEVCLFLGYRPVIFLDWQALGSLSVQLAHGKGEGK